MSVFPTSEIGLPKEVNYQLPSSLDQSARSYTFAQQPSGQTTVVGATMNTTVFAANDAGFKNQAFNSTPILFDLPCAQGPSVFLDCAATTLSFKMTWQVTTATVVGSGANLAVKLIGGASSFFDTLQLNTSNSPIENINNYGQLANTVINSMVNFADRYSLGFAGCDSDSANGIDLVHAATGTYSYTFTIPLLSMIGQSTDKFLPIGLINNLQLSMTTSAFAPITAFCTVAPTTQPVFAPIVLSDFVLNGKLVDLGPSAGQAILSSLRDGKLYLKTATYTNSNATISAGSSGLQSSLLQIRNSSVKSIFFYNALDKGALAVNGNYEALTISQGTQCVVGGSNRFPTREMDPIRRPSEALVYYLEAWGKKGSWQNLSSIISRNYYARMPVAVPSFADQSLVQVANGQAPASAGSTDGSVELIKYPSMSYYGFDMETAPALLSGLNTKMIPPYINQNIATAYSGTITVFGWSLSDVILEVDAVSKNVVAYI